MSQHHVKKPYSVPEMQALHRKYVREYQKTGKIGRIKPRDLAHAKRISTAIVDEANRVRMGLPRKPTVEEKRRTFQTFATSVLPTLSIEPQRQDPDRLLDLMEEKPPVYSPEAKVRYGE